ncbi:MAG: SPOR domain-containing protein [Candidatus Omnitrophica bacterium]|nr:SPOR domain-containing protein [Candidatus Omnitrophota bacterium]MDD4012651.1 SPOR domain-containing protein [Candidatus Omnitrophota bacterium]
MPLIKLPVEYAAVLSIVVLITVIVAYAAGVEQGKRLAYGPNAIGRVIQPDDEEAFPVFDEDLLEKKAQELLRRVENEEKTEETEKAVEETPALPAEDNTLQPKEQVITHLLQLASSKNEVFANEEISRLRARGYDARISKKGDWFKIYIPCGSKEDAEKAKKKLEIDFNDCIIVRSST